jgi:hypothetical protein
VCHTCAAHLVFGGSTARETGQIIRRRPSTWLVRICVGRDSETRKRKYIGKSIHGEPRDAYHPEPFQKLAGIVRRKGLILQRRNRTPLPFQNRVIMELFLDSAVGDEENPTSSGDQISNPIPQSKTA